MSAPAAKLLPKFDDPSGAARSVGLVRCASLDGLSPLFARRARAFLEAVASRGLPVVVYETHRSAQRQRHLAGKGASSIVNSPHMHGLAFDLVLDTDPSLWYGDDRPTAVNGGGAPWDTGLDGEEIVRPHVFEVWRELGELAQEHGLVWGGRWRKVGKHVADGWPMLGADPYHFQMRDWQAAATT